MTLHKISAPRGRSLLLSPNMWGPRLMPYPGPSHPCMCCWTGSWKKLHNCSGSCRAALARHRLAVDRDWEASGPGEPMVGRVQAVPTPTVCCECATDVSNTAQGIAGSDPTALSILYVCCLREALRMFIACWSKRTKTSTLNHGLLSLSHRQYVLCWVFLFSCLLGLLYSRASCGLLSTVIHNTVSSPSASSKSLQSSLSRRRCARESAFAAKTHKDSSVTNTQAEGHTGHIQIKAFGSAHDLLCAKPQMRGF